MNQNDEARVLLWSHRLSAVQTGIGRYVVEITRALSRTAGGAPALRYELCAGPEPGAPDWVPANVPVNRLGPNRRALHLAWTAVHRPYIERFAGDADLVHALLPAVPVPTRAPLVVTVHDLFPLEHPEWYTRLERWTFRRALDWSVSHASHFVAVTDHTGNRLVSRFGIEPGRVSVISPGISERFLSPVDPGHQRAVLERYSLTAGEYAIAVGAINSRKNLATVVAAIARLPPPLSLVVAGPTHGGEEQVMATADRLSVAERVRVIGPVPDQDLPCLLKGAVALVHPSLDEGFGFPPLEAMAVGTPAIVAISGSLPEVVGDAALRVDPRDPDDWAAAIAELLCDSARRRMLVEAGRARVTRFTWDGAARKLASLHRDLASA